MALANKIKLYPANQMLRIKSYLCVYPTRCCSSGKSGKREDFYDKRKFGHHLPDPNVKPEFQVLEGIPSGIFRDTTGEVLGRCAHKECPYKNPEYFSYHHMSFFDFHLHLRKYRLPSPDTKRKPP